MDSKFSSFIMNEIFLIHKSTYKTYNNNKKTHQNNNSCVSVEFGLKVA